MAGAEAAGSPYEVLGVTPGASPQAIVHAYRRLARSSHPDARPDDPAAAVRFRTLADAYEVLGDPVRRAAYDRARNREGEAWHARAPGGFATEGRWGHDVGHACAASTSSRDILLDASSSQDVEAPLRAGPVRVEGSEEHVPERVWPRAAAHGELREVTASLMRFLGDGWWAE
jgi:DnaJ-class molecular chaperone